MTVTKLQATSILKPSHGIETALVTVTPDMAETWLKRNEKNRRPSKTLITGYARDMLAGAWQLTGDAIRFAPDGRLLDGQQRLMACIQSGCSFQTFVMHNVPEPAQTVMDIGRKRSVGDQLEISGSSYPNKVAAAARTMLYMADAIDGKRATVSEVLAVIERHPNLEESARLCSVNAGIAPGTLTAVHYCAAYLLGDMDRANDFVHVVKTGIPSMNNCAVHRLREKLLRHKGMTMRRETMVHSVVHAWNLFYNETPIAKFVTPDDYVPMQGLDTNKI